MPLGGGPVEQRGRVVQPAGDPAADLGQRQRQVELGRGVGRPDRADLQPGQRQLALLAVGPGEHHLQQRGVGQAARRVDQLHHLLERQVLVIQRGQRGVPGASDQLGRARPAGQVDPDRQGVDEEADQPFQLGPAPVRGRGADHHVGLAGQPGQHQRPGRQHHHEQRAAVLLGQRLQPGGQLGVEAQPELLGVVVLHRRPGPVGGQLQQRRRAGQRPAPVLALLGQPAAGQLGPLPGRVVGVLDVQRRQRVVRAGVECRVQRAQFGGEQPHRPAVGHDVVQGQQQHVPVRRQHQ